MPKHFDVDEVCEPCPIKRTGHPERLSVAPMMDWTDRHCRMFHRLLAPDAMLYTEMIHSGAILHGDRDRFLGFSIEEQPLSVQVGGSDPDDLARCTAIAQAFGYNEINLNCGCPSSRVQSGAFGVVLMHDPALVARCVRAMRDASPLPVTVKCRIGIDDSDGYAFLHRFAAALADAGCGKIIVHARKAWLKGLSPKENREVPPLEYDKVFRLKENFKNLQIVLNGGIGTATEAVEHLARVDGVMIGRRAYKDPVSLHEFQSALFGKTEPLDRLAVVERMAAYARTQAKHGVSLWPIARHMLGLFNGTRGARRWRREIGSLANTRHAHPAALVAAASVIVEDRLPNLDP